MNLMASLERTRAAVEASLRQHGEVTLHSDGQISVRHGSAEIFVDVDDLGQDHTWITMRSPLLTGVPRSPALLEYVATNASSRGYGTLSLIPEDDPSLTTVVLSCGLLATGFDDDELEVALTHMARGADELDDQIESLFGGRRLH